MLFSESIPDKLQEYPNVTSFMAVLDGMQDFKNEVIAESFRVNNSAILMDKKWLLKKLEEFGITNIPLDYPIQILRQYLLNVDTICGTRGSKIGIELYCSVLSLGEVTIDDSQFYSEPQIILLDSIEQGYILENSSDKVLYLTDNNDLINPEVPISITIKSRFFNGSYESEAALIKSYLQNNIITQLGFSNSRVNFTFQSADEFYFHRLLNPYFV